MIQVCKYNHRRDIMRVDVTGYFDICEAYSSGSVPATVPDSEERFNGIEDPRSIGGRPSDQFDAAQANIVIAGYKAPEPAPNE